jgi:predicted RNase H-like nuclease (RuvC/YqgF family)
MPGTKRKRRSSGGFSSHGDELMELRQEVKRVREENEKLKAEMDQQSQHSLAMMTQIAELQDALRHGLGQNALGAPTAQMI